MQDESAGVLDARFGYDRVSKAYDAWKWQEFWRRNEMPWIEKIVRNMPLGRVLDVGTGTGRYAELVRSVGHEAYGIDVSERMLDRARERLGLKKPESFLLRADATNIPFKERYFDLVLCCRVLSHVDTLTKALSEIHRVLKKGAHAVISDIDGRHGYEATRIPISADEHVNIRVHKYRMDRLMDEVMGIGFIVRDYKLFCAPDLAWKPDRQAFPSIDWSGRRPIFYQLVLERNA
jgi:ubiquinone/menaquinone biosynthesis C-methylase UbiE